MQIVALKTHFSEDRTCWLGRLETYRRNRRRRLRGRGRRWNTGPSPLDVRHGGAHEPRVLPPPRLHVAQWDRPEDEHHRTATALTERWTFISIIEYFHPQKAPQLQDSFNAAKPHLQQYIIGKQSSFWRPKCIISKTIHPNPTSDWTLSRNSTN